MIFGAIGFVCFIGAVIFYLHKDNTAWKEMSNRLSLFCTNFSTKLNEAVKEIKEADASNKALRTALMASKTRLDQVEDHNHRIQQTVLLLDGKLKILQDQVKGINVNLPSNVSISITKDVKNATSRITKGQVKTKKQDNKIRRKGTKPSTHFKRNASI